MNSNGYFNSLLKKCMKLNFFFHNQEIVLIKQITYDQGEDINYD